MTRLARRTANANYEMVSIIVRVQHEVGGNLAQILDSVGYTLRERFELRRQVDAVTAATGYGSAVTDSTVSDAVRASAADLPALKIPLGM